MSPGRRTAVAAVLAALVAAASAIAADRGSGALGATTACGAHRFTLAFDPRRSATATSRERLAAVSFWTRWVATSGSCRRTAAPRVYRSNGLVESHRAIRIRCSAPQAIKLHVNAIVDRDTGERVGNTLVIGVGEPLTVIASAVLKNHGDPLAASLYRSRRYCHVL